MFKRNTEQIMYKTAGTTTGTRNGEEIMYRRIISSSNSAQVHQASEHSQYNLGLRKEQSFHWSAFLCIALEGHV